MFPRSLFLRARNTIFDGSLKEKIFFLHVPKCAGTSIDEAIRSCYLTLDIRRDRFLVRHDSRAAAKVGSVLYGLDYTYGTTKDFQILHFGEQHLAYYMSLKPTKYISGHITFSDRVFKKFSDEFKFVTVLRDPVKRWISLYFHAKYRQSDRWLIESDIMEYLESDRGKSHGYDYVKFLGGAREESDYTSRNAIENTKKNLLKFEIVGCLESLDHFMRCFDQRFGTHLKIRRRNESLVSDSYRRSVITEDVQEKIREVCKPDLEIYRYAIGAGLFPNNQK